MARVQDAHRLRNLGALRHFRDANGGRQKRTRGHRGALACCGSRSERRERPRLDAPVLGNLAAVDTVGKFEGILTRYLAPIRGPVMITASNTCKGAAEVGLAKPALTDMGAEVEAAAMLQLIKETPVSRLPALVRSLKQENKLTPPLLLTALRENMLAFFEAALSALAAVRLEQVRNKILHAGASPVIELFRQAGIPATMYDDFWEALEVVRKKS